MPRTVSSPGPKSHGFYGRRGFQEAQVGLSRSESAELVDSVLHEISDALVRGETIKLSSFGSFVVRQKGERVGRNPKTGDEAPILPRRVLVFRASPALKERVK